jgi:hypothetical protein
MANPNIVNVTDIRGNTSSLLITTTDNPFAVPIINNPASSNKIYKINTIIVSHVGSSGTANIAIRLFSQDDLGGTGNSIISSVEVPYKSSLVVLDKNTSLYLNEDRSIGATANTASNLVVTASWEEIS